MGMGMDPRYPANKGWGWGWTPDPRQIGGWTLTPDPRQIGDGDGMGIRGSVRVAAYCDHQENRARESVIGRVHCTQRGITASQRAETIRSVPRKISGVSVPASGLKTMSGLYTRRWAASRWAEDSQRAVSESSRWAEVYQPAG
jgi:hypothetical protein